MTHELIAILPGPEERERLGRIADVLIPGGAGLPSASAADAVAEPLDRVLAADPLLSRVLTDVVRRPGAPDAVLEDLRRSDEDAYERLVFAVSGAYFMVPQVRRALGYPGIAPRRSPAADDESDFYLEDGVLQPVIDRGPIYRHVP